MSYGIQLTDASFWVEAESLEKYLEQEDCSLEQFLENECWEFRVDEDGNVTDVDLKNEFLDDEIEPAILGIAPFVKPGSFIELEGEDGATARFDFNGKKMKKSGEIF